MTIGPASPLRVVPSALPSRDARFIDGIRYSIQMAELAYARLRSAAHQAADTVRGNRKPSPETLPDLFVNAWSIIDSTKRLRILLMHFPGMKRNFETKAFLANTKGVVELRNQVQHLDGDIERLAGLDEPTWGSLSWVVPDYPPTEELVVFSVTAVAGAIRDFSRPLVNPAGRQVRPPVDLVELTSSGVTVSLSRILDGLDSVVAGLERDLAQRFSGMTGGTDAADLLLAAEMVFTPMDAS